MKLFQNSMALTQIMLTHQKIYKIGMHTQHIMTIHDKSFSEAIQYCWIYITFVLNSLVISTDGTLLFMFTCNVLLQYSSTHVS